MAERGFVTAAMEERSTIDYHPSLPAQLGLCFRRLLRRFRMRHEWRYILYAALASLIASLLVNDVYFITIEGTLTGSFLFILLGLWIGALGSIQTVCRERNGIRREVRAGMYVSAYVISSAFYQALLSAAEAVVIVVVSAIAQVHFPKSGVIFPWFPLDFGITMFLVIFSSAMFAFLISAFMTSAAMAMAALQFFLIFQLVFSGVFVSFLPPFSVVIQKFAIANRGIEVINSEADYNELPMRIIWDKITEMRDFKAGGETSLGKILEMVKADNEVYHSVKTIRETQVGAVLTVEEVMSQLRNNPKFEPLRRYEVMSLFEIGELLDLIHETGLLDSMKNYTVGANFTLGEIIDWLATSPKLEAFRDEEFGRGITVGQVIDFFGEDEARSFVETKSAQLLRNDRYVKTPGHVGRRWLYLGIFALAYTAAAGVSLKLLCR